jgi:hypothetical protein
MNRYSRLQPFPSPFAMSDLPTRESATLLQPTSRRGVLGTLGLATAALAVSTSPASAFILTRKKSAEAPAGVDLNSFPAEWRQLQGALLPDYSRYLAALKLKKITPQQVLDAHAKERSGVWNNLPPKQWWNRMGYTLRVVDRIALELNSPISEILSAYRSPAYNARCAGARTGSWHQANVAVDVKFPIRASVVTATTRNLRDRGLFKGGVGSYWNFTHIDTRGQNINW